MPQDLYPTVTQNGREYWRMDGFTLVDKDPTGECLFFIKTPQGNRGVFGPLIKGDDGLTPEFQSGATNELEWNDATPASTVLVKLSPGDPDAGIPPTYKIDSVRHKGRPGNDGASVLNPASFSGTRSYRRMLQLNSDASAFEYTPQKVGDMKWASAVSEAPANTAAGFTLATISVAANTIPFDWRIDPEGISYVSSSAADNVVDLICRLNDGNGAVLGKCGGMAGLADRLILASGPDTSASGSVNKVSANAAATVVLRTEKRAGSGTYQTGVLGETRFKLNIIAVI